MRKYSYLEKIRQFKSSLAPWIGLVLITGCSTTSIDFLVDKDVMAKQVCSALPIGVPLDVAAAAMYAKYSATLMGGNERQAFIALKEPVHCACHVGLGKNRLTTTDILVHCLP